MTRTELKNLHQIATNVRNLAHKAYEIALKNRQTPGDTEAAYQTLLEANRAMTAIYAQIIKLSTQPEPTPTVEGIKAAAPAPVEAPAVEAPRLFRVTYVTSGLRRRVRTLDEEAATWLRDASHTGMRLIGTRPATEREIERGAFTGFLNS